MTTNSNAVAISTGKNRIGDKQKRHMKDVERHIKITYDEFENTIDEFLDIDIDNLSSDAIYDYYNLLNDFLLFDYVTESELNESRLYTKSASTSLERTYARKYYKQKKNRIKSKRDILLKSVSHVIKSKKKEIQSKKNKTITGRDKRKYHTKNHLQEKLENDRDFFFFQNQKVTRDDILSINLTKKNLCTIVLKDDSILTERTNDNQSTFKIDSFLTWYHKDENKEMIARKYFINEGIYYV